MTCGGGLTHRQRLCDNPAPSAFGQPCIGNDEQTQQCNTSPCSSTTLGKLDGGWSTWTDWGSCSVTCGVGLMKRQRQCDNPVPSGFGQSCSGNNEQTDKCNLKSCRIPSKLFTFHFTYKTVS